jgi:uncharacterized glyoxalase superfamily protein PhnB
MVNYIPEGTHTVTPHLVIRGAAKAIDFYTRAFGAREHYRMPMPDGGVAHAELQIGDSLIYLADESPQGAGRAPRSATSSSVVIHLYVEDADASIQRAAGAGATVTMPAMDMFWGDRFGQVRDPFGHLWSIATHKEDLTPEEMGKKGAEAMAAMPSMPKPPKTRPMKTKTKKKAAPRSKSVRNAGKKTRGK